MAFFALSGITGCIAPLSSSTEAYDVMYNDTYIQSFFKKDAIVSHAYVYYVICNFINHRTIFAFSSASDRDTFYDSLS